MVLRSFLYYLYHNIHIVQVLCNCGISNSCWLYVWIYNTIQKQKSRLKLKAKMSLAALNSFVHRLDYLTWMPSKVSHRIFTISFNKGRFFSKMLQKNWNTFLFICVLLYSTNRTIFWRQKWMNQLEHFFIKLSQIYCSILNENHQID